MSLSIVFAVAVTISRLCGANPVPEPDPYRSTHIKIHLPHDVHTVHHHHVEKVPVLHEVPIIKEVPVLKEVPIIKHVPFIKTVHVPIVKTIAVEKPIILHDHLSYSSWH